MVTGGWDSDGLEGPPRLMSGIEFTDNEMLVEDPTSPANCPDRVRPEDTSDPDKESVAPAFAEAVQAREPGELRAAEHPIAVGHQDVQDRQFAIVERRRRCVSIDAVVQ